ncbi:Nif3-like dinuclear metal center hexameric protein [Pseudodesulfovibrio sp. zrk46]|uniref:Nif3-like dinuclear metal center hexameric protein n=1 Tax=Pseudodesulfovibrio sp. zrk46 TaxID=2725288 RepID=UPI001449BA5A|nr:Nif3-like dinuclear metal center hexameric protein [Pseudodesulfovibrio sp. zrk46]QJB56414.1 Nif3-like dinuclear metal center hexameric protein [Pseudodesulfovibrio sp. zrk46]
MKIKDILPFFRKLAPEENQSSWDNCGVQIAAALEETDKVAVCLEPTPEMVDKCLDWGAGAILTHHPLYMKPKPLDSTGMYWEVVRSVMNAGAVLYSAHTSLDTRPGGPAFWLGQDLGLTDTRFLEVEHSATPIEVSFHVNEPIERETANVWANHAGIHSVSQSNAGEVRVICDESAWGEIASGIEFSLGKRPLFYIRSLTGPRSDVGFGEVGTLPEPMQWEDFADKLAELTGCEVFSFSGKQPETVTRVAYCGGSGSSLVGKAAKAGADVLVTGDVKYHGAVETPICLVDVGHFSLEEEMMRRFAAELDGELDGVEVKFFQGVDPFQFHVKQ